MSIIISQKGRNALRVDREVIAQENYLQEYIYNNPESLPLQELKDNLRLLIIAREFDTASGPIDVLAVDAEGEIYIIETKLYKNTDKRRVIAQMLDYGAAMWEAPAQLISKAEDTVWRTRLLEFLGGDEDRVTAHREAMQRNVAAGRFWFVVLMDQLDDRLRQLISFVNINSRFKVLGVQLDFYRHQDFEIIIPNLYGAESATETGGAAFSRKAVTKSWNEDQFFATAEVKVGADLGRQMHAFYRHLRTDDRFEVSETPSTFRVAVRSGLPKPIFHVYDYGNMLINFGELSKLGDAGRGYCERLGALLQQGGFLTLGPDYMTRYPAIPVSVYGRRTSEVLQIALDSVKA